MKTLEAWVLAYLLNSLWQVPLVFAAAWFAARSVRRNGPATEHRVWVIALALEAVLPACSVSPGQFFGDLFQLIPWNWASHSTHIETHVTVLTGAGYEHGLLQLPTYLLATVAFAYACSVAYVAVLLWRFSKTSVMHRRAQRIVLTGAAARMWIHCSCIFAVQNAELAASREITYPMTIGVRRRLVLLPAELPVGLYEEDLDAAIAHEFAHMRRRDFAKNLIYAVLSLPVAYHPLLWLTRARVEESREMICDAMAAEAVAGSHQYARSLLRLASLLVQGAPDRTLHAIGIFDANIFERRVMNLTQKSMELRGVRWLATAAACVLIGLGTCASALALRVNVAAPLLQSGTEQGPQDGTAPHIPARVMAANRLTTVSPIYPPEARAAGVSGKVLLRAQIGKDGTIKNLQVVSGPDEFRKSALDAVRQWTYKPYMLNGDPTEVDTTITVNYSLKQ